MRKAEAAPAELWQLCHSLERPIDRRHPPKNPPGRNRARLMSIHGRKISRIQRDQAVVSKDKKFPLPKRHWMPFNTHGRHACGARIPCHTGRPRCHDPVDPDLTANNLQILSRESYYALCIQLPRIVWSAKNNNVPPPQRQSPRHDDAVQRRQRWRHRVGWNAECLRQ